MNKVSIKLPTYVLQAISLWEISSPVQIRMLLSDALRTQGDQQGWVYLYHTAPTTNLGSIMKLGLLSVPTRLGLSTNRIIRGIYLADSPTWVVDVIKNKGLHKRLLARRYYIVLQVKVHLDILAIPDPEFEPLEFGPGGVGVGTPAFVVFGRIPLGT